MEGVHDARTRLRGVVRRTPLIELNLRGDTWLLKAESLQLGGSFKLRGAYNRLAQLPASVRSRGVVAFSSGNHAQGVARAARMLGMPALIVMPADAPRVKLEATRALGAEIRLYDRATESREAIAAEIALERDAALVPSFDDCAVIEGQGTVGAEAEEQAGEAIERVVVPCGGGGLAAGIALALPDAEIVVAEPAGWDDMGRSLDLGRIVPVEAGAPPTSCDALQTIRVAERTFGVLERHRARGVAVTELEVEEAMRCAFGQGLVVEPGGAVALAAVLAGKVQAGSRRSLIILSGSNVDPALFARVIAA